MNYFFIICFSFSSLLWASNWQAEGQGQLVELYTSEGCSSCPPADAWISGLVTHPDLWKKVVPLSFHVDYWDGLGWPDKFASPMGTARQRQYASLWQSGKIYTPGVVIQGKEARVTNQFQEGLTRFSAKWDGKSLELMGNIPLGSTVHYAWLGMNIKSIVKRGENAGKTLSHDFVVLNFGSLGEFKGNEKLNLNLPEKTPERPQALAIWLERSGVPLSAIGNVL